MADPEPFSRETLLALLAGTGITDLPEDQIERLAAMTQSSRAAAARLPMYPKEKEPALIFVPPGHHAR